MIDIMKNLTEEKENYEALLIQMRDFQFQPKDLEKKMRLAIFTRLQLIIYPFLIEI